MNRLSKKKGFIFDLDGVIWKGNKVIPGCPEVIQKLNYLNKKYVFVSNNSSMSKLQIQKKLKKFGIETNKETILNAPAVTAKYIANLQAEGKVFVIGMDGLKQEMLNAGLQLAEEPEQAQYLVAGFDKNLDYQKLSHALRSLLAGAKFIATNEDGLLPTENGFLPGAGATVGAIKGMIKQNPDIIIGKPNDIMVKMALDFMKLKPEQCLFVGDSLQTDIILANNSNICSVLVLTGNTIKENLASSQIKPTYVLQSVVELLNYF